MVRLQLRIRFPHKVTHRVFLLILALLPVVLSSALVVYRVRATAPDSPSAPNATLGVRQFYVSQSYVQANEARSACAEGYHFASIWEIADPSSLQYNTALGLQSPNSDSGEGPPTAFWILGSAVPVYGWVRTGYDTSHEEFAGQANCSGWLSNLEGDWGTVANLPSNWTGGAQDVGVWNTEVRTCDTQMWVWCVQDDAEIYSTYLPLAVKDSP